MRAGRSRAHARPDWDRHARRTWTSAYLKDEVAGVVAIGALGLEGDEQHDREHHGGPDMAVLAYASAHYPLWREELDLPEMGPGGFGENLTVEGLDEWGVCLGDVLEAGTVRMQVSQPRAPCANISRRWNRKDLLARVTANRRTGWYLRVPQPGTLAAGDAVRVVDRPWPGWAVERVLRARLDPDADPEAVAFLARCPDLSGPWRQRFTTIEARRAS